MTPVRIDVRTAKAYSHPVRADILDLLDGGEARSPSEIADQLGVPLGNVAYHVRTLTELGFLRLERTQPVRGALEHFYRSVS